MKLTEVALKYLKAGFSVIPLNGKIPKVDWKVYQTRYPTETEIEGWFSDGKSNIGIVTGKISGITVIDIDAKSGGLETLKKLNLPITWMVKTGGGGWHYYYKYDERIQQTAGIYQGVDIRNDGGQVVAPPSTHQSGNKYEWSYKEDELVNFPIELFKKENLIKNNNWKEILTNGSSQGTRNQTATKVFGKLLTIFKQEDWDCAWQIGKTWNLNNTPPLSDNELKSVYDSIVKREILKVASITSIPVKTNYNLRYTWGTRELDISLAIIKRGNFIVAASKSGSGKTTFVFDMACKNALKGHKVLFLSLEMDEQDIKEDFGRKYAGITIAEELDYNIPKHKQDSFNQKINDINSITNLKIQGVRRAGNIQWEDLVEIIKLNGETDLVFIDNLDLISSKDGENDLERQKRIVKSILNFTAVTKIPIVLIHHYRKSQANGKDMGLDEMSGSGKIRDGADRIIKITRVSDPLAVYPDKYRTTIYLQKGRGYPEVMKDVFFIRGTFVDNPPSLAEYENKQPIEEIAETFGGDIIY